MEPPQALQLPPSTTTATTTTTTTIATTTSFCPKTTCGNPGSKAAVLQRLRTMPFGHPILKSLFMLDPTYIHVNHGGCGATPKYVIAKQRQLVDTMEHHPDRWFKKIAPCLVRDAAASLASFIGAEPEEVVFVVNATTGINSVIRSLDLQQGDSVLCLDVTYRPVLNTLRFVCTARQELVELVELPIPLPLPSSDAIVRMVEDALTKTPNVRLAVFDHITSPTALLLPVEQLVHICHQHNVTVLIDGAHAPGQVTVNMNQIGADFYVGTCGTVAWVVVVFLSPYVFLGFFFFLFSFHSSHANAILYQYTACTCRYLP
jgi:isopenicillin-N epimerase